MNLNQKHEKKVEDLKELAKQKQRLISDLEQVNIAIARTEGAIIELYSLIKESEQKQDSVMGDATEIEKGA